MKKSGMLCLVWILSAVLLSGCGKGNDSGMEGNASAEEGENAGAAENNGDAANIEESESASEDAEAASPQIEFEGVDINGNEVSSAVFSESRLTMVNVWATYCNPCLREMPGLGELAAEYDKEEFQIIGIISDVQEESGEDMLELAASLIEQTGADYPHLLLNESLYFAMLTEVSAVPTTFFIDENGVVLDVVVGSMEKWDWEEKISALLEE